MVSMEMSQHCVINLPGSRIEVLNIFNDPLAAALLVIGNGLVPPYVPVTIARISGIDHPCGAVRKNHKGTVALAGTDAMDIHIALFPCRKILILPCGFPDLEVLQGLSLLGRERQYIVISALLEVVEALIIDRHSNRFAYREHFRMKDKCHRKNIP